MPLEISDFCIVGINYKNTDACTRGLFAINFEQYENILDTAGASGLSSLFILSTCNRTEIYGLAQSPAQLADLLCAQTHADKATFENIVYKKSGLAAIEHLFNVGAGLDSQILGDYEIVSQLKQAVRFAKERNFISGLLEKLTNQVLEASKTIRTNTAFSGGSVSVSFAAVQCMKDFYPDLSKRKILVVGAGKIGGNVCKNLLKYANSANITIINRSVQKAKLLAAELKMNYACADKIAHYLEVSDIILLATNSTTPLVLKTNVQRKGKKLILDMSIPANAEPSIKTIPEVTLVNIDRLSKLKDNTIDRRIAEIPRVKAIIAEHSAAFLTWLNIRKKAPVLVLIKAKLTALAMKHQPLAEGERASFEIKDSEQKIQLVLKRTANKMRTQHNIGCHYLEAINDFIEMAPGGSFHQRIN
jgi:glutamyl-tRNA reductase